MRQPLVGVIGGSGLYEIEGVTDLVETPVATPFGAPSDAVLVGRLGDTPVAFLSRHGRGHLHPPHQINYRANIWALKSLGVRWLISVSAVGSMRAEIAPGDLVLADQFIDRTRARSSTFFEDGVATHVGFADPVCPVLRGALRDAARTLDLPVRDGGTYVCIDGPLFSTRAESNLYRSWGVDVVGMTNLPEAKLAREAQIAYATIAMATDYDCWHEDEDDVTVEGVIAVLRDNVARAKRLIAATVDRLGELGPSPAWSALQDAVMTQRDRIPAQTLARVRMLLDDTEHHAR